MKYRNKLTNDELDNLKYYLNKVKESNLLDKYKDGIRKKFYIETFGCQMNENDSEKLAGMLLEMGFIETCRKEESQFIIFNTCCVRENAEEKVYGHLGALKKFKKENPDTIIAICGCMMQQRDIVEYIYKTYKHVDIVFGTYNVHMLPEFIFNVLEKQDRIVNVWESEGAITEGLPFNRKENVKAWVTVMYGCNNFCSYCIVPYVRGRERSREVKDILNEVKELSNNGFKEITLLGQNVNSYGKDLECETNFAKLLSILNEVDGIERIRFMTSHPKDLSDELILAIKNCKKVSKYLHLPVQSGSTKVLSEMNRVYTKEGYLKLINKVRFEIPDIAITTDIIVGFPGETTEDFNDTLDVIKEARFDSAYTFLYSKRTGTPSATRDDQVLEEDKKERFNKLLNIQNEISNEINNTYYDKNVEVLVEGKSKNNPDMLTGRTDSNKVVNFKGDECLIGKLANIKITQIQTWSLGGVVTNKLI